MAHTAKCIRKNLPPLLKPSDIGDGSNLIPDRTEQELIDAGNEQLGKEGCFTAEFLFKRKPEVYRVILHYLKEQMPMRHICSLCKVSCNTVAAILQREEEQLQPAKDFFLSRAKALARLSMERLEELLPEMDARDAAIISGIMIDKMLLLSGEATVIVAHKKDIPSHSDFNALIDQLPQANARVVNDAHIETQAPCNKRLNPPIVTQTPAKLTVSQTVPVQS